MLKLDRVVNIAERSPSTPDRLFDAVPPVETSHVTDLESMRERERSRIARDIHDELGQALTGLKFDLVRLSMSHPRLLELRMLTTEIDRLILSVQRIATDLHPPVLDDLGLVAALEWYAHAFEQRCGIRCRFRRCGQSEDTIDPDRRTAIFRIFQEILTNVARHANATRIAAALTIGPRIIRLHVQDNGCGVPASVGHGFGLLSMRERAAAFGGCVMVHRAARRGTTVSVRLPRLI